MTRGSRAAIAVLSVALAAVLVPGCQIRDKICDEGEYPVRRIKSGGGTCVKEGEPPPKGFRTYPPGEVPTYADEQ